MRLYIVVSPWPGNLANGWDGMGWDGLGDESESDERPTELN
jgi:hypothetical protein